MGLPLELRCAHPDEKVDEATEAKSRNHKRTQRSALQRSQCDATKRTATALPAPLHAAHTGAAALAVQVHVIGRHGATIGRGGANTLRLKHKEVRPCEST